MISVNSYVGVRCKSNMFYAGLAVTPAFSVLMLLVWR